MDFGFEGGDSGLGGCDALEEVGVGHCEGFWKVVVRVEIRAFGGYWETIFGECNRCGNNDFSS